MLRLLHVFIFVCLVLPVLTSLPRVDSGSITATSVVLEWDTWNPDAGDSGDGPIVAYNVYDTHSMTLIQTEVVTQEMISPITRLIQNLTPSTIYHFEVRPVREGPGGEGTATRFVTVFTASLSTEPHSQVTTKISTSRIITETRMPTDTTYLVPGIINTPTVEAHEESVTKKTKGNHVVSAESFWCLF